MKTILITGGLGFIGSNFIQMIFEKYNSNVKIINIDKDTLGRHDHNHLKHISQISDPKCYLYRQVDICDTAKMQALIYLYRPDKIIHFAAQSHVDVSIETPQKHAHTNILGTISILIAASKYYNLLLDDNSKKEFRFHHVSTDEVFGDLPLDSKDQFTQSTQYNPSSPYSATKGGSDHLVRAWGRTYGLPYSISNCSNNYGKYQDDTKLIPKIIKQCLNKEPITVHGTGEYIRDWIYVLDHCQGILKILENLEVTRNKTYLFGGNCEMSNMEVILSIIDAISEQDNEYREKLVSNIRYVENRQGQDYKYSINSAKSKTELNWNTTTNLKCHMKFLVYDYKECH